MNKSERDDLIRLARSRARLAKMQVTEREKILLADAEDLMAAEFRARDELWAEATQIAEEAARKANEIITARCADLGIPAKYAPQLRLGWLPRSDEFLGPARRAELRKVAAARLAALRAAASRAIDEAELKTETELIAGSLESADARAFLSAMPTPEQLMPPLSLDDLGVTTWQPPEGAAAALLTPETTAGRRRRKVLAAIAQDPAASDREIGRRTGVDHKTVAAYRRPAEFQRNDRNVETSRVSATAGELPAQPGEFPSDDE